MVREPEAKGREPQFIWVDIEYVKVLDKALVELRVLGEPLADRVGVSAVLLGVGLGQEVDESRLNHQPDNKLREDLEREANITSRNRPLDPVHHLKVQCEAKLRSARKNSSIQPKIEKIQKFQIHQLTYCVQHK